MNKSELEQTLVLIKPDALKNSLTGYVLSLLSEFHTGLRFAGVKIVHVNEMLAKEHYTEHRGKHFYTSLIDYITGRIHYSDDPWKRRVIALVYQGPSAVTKIREICGPTNPLAARETKPGCIRSLGTIVPMKDKEGNVKDEYMENLIHASASREEAEREIKLWFRPNDIPPLMHAYPTEESKEHYYYKEGRLYTVHESESACLVAPGDPVWKSDLDALRRLTKGETPPQPLEAVAAKYLINQGTE
ncbi:MAG: hypothetical protein GF401_12185 [Chitinivibrionales bacterium]|nr:hypothetical protein [Chitinivibrionales bacterium]